MSVFKTHFWVYWKSIRTVFLILLGIIAFNLILQASVAKLAGGSIGDIPMLIAMPMIFAASIGALIGVPIIQITSLPYLLTFGGRRKDVVLTATTLNLILALSLSLLFTLLMGFYANSTTELAPLYMGKIITSWSDMLPITAFNVLMLLMFTSVIFLLAVVFYRRGILWGLGATTLIISVPLFFITEIYYFYNWGSSYLFLYLVMSSVILLSILFSNKVLAKAEIHPDYLKTDIKGTLILLLSLIIFTALIYSGISRFNADSVKIISTYGRYGVYEGIQEDSFYVDEDKELNLTFRSRISEGNIIFNIYSPNNELVYSATSTTNEQAVIPLTAGEWRYSLIFSEAKDGEYSLQAYIR